MSQSENGSANSDPNTKKFSYQQTQPPPGSLLEQEETQTDWSKVRLMEFLRGMDDNQKTLDTVNAADRANRDWQFRERQRLNRELLGPNEIIKGIEYPEDAMSTFRIDSPDIHHHYHAPASQNPNPTNPAAPLPTTPTQAEKSTLRKLLPLALGTALALGGTGAGIGIYNLLRPASTMPPAVNTENTEGFLLNLRQADPKPVP